MNRGPAFLLSPMTGRTGRASVLHVVTVQTVHAGGLVTIDWSGRQLTIPYIGNPTAGADHWMMKCGRTCLLLAPAGVYLGGNLVVTRTDSGSDSVFDLSDWPAYGASNFDATTGDHMLAVLAGVGQTITPPSGYTVAGSGTNGENNWIAASWRYGDPSTHVFTMAGAATGTGNPDPDGLGLGIGKLFWLRGGTPTMTSQADTTGTTAYLTEAAGALSFQFAAMVPVGTEGLAVDLTNPDYYSYVYGATADRGDDEDTWRNVSLQNTLPTPPGNVSPPSSTGLVAVGGPDLDEPESAYWSSFTIRAG